MSTRSSILCAALGAAISVISVACSSAVVGTGDDSTKASTTSTTSSDPCRPPVGTYEVRYTKEASSSPQCPALPDDVTTISDAQPDGGTGSFLGKAREKGCTINEDASTCAYAIHCEQTQNGVDVVSDSTLYTSGSQPSGTSKVVSASTTCSYTILWQRR